MAEVEELLQEGKALGLQLHGLPRLISMMAQARSFNMRARRALHKGAHRPVSQYVLLSISPADAHTCLALWLQLSPGHRSSTMRAGCAHRQGVACYVQLALTEITLDDSGKEYQALRRFGCPAATEEFRWRAGAEKPSYADVSSLADAAADLPVTSPLTESIMDIVNAADDWLEAARKTVAKRNSGQKLGKCLQWMLASLDRALEQFTLRLQVHATSLLFFDHDTCYFAHWSGEAEDVRKVHVLPCPGKRIQ